MKCVSPSQNSPLGRKIHTHNELFIKCFKNIPSGYLCHITLNPIMRCLTANSTFTQPSTQLPRHIFSFNLEKKNHKSKTTSKLFQISEPFENQWNIKKWKIFCIHDGLYAVNVILSHSQYDSYCLFIYFNNEFSSCFFSQRAYFTLTML